MDDYSDFPDEPPLGADDKAEVADFEALKQLFLRYISEDLAGPLKDVPFNTSVVAFLAHLRALITLAAMRRNHVEQRVEALESEAKSSALSRAQTLKFRGEWDEFKQYGPGDLVLKNG